MGLPPIAVAIQASDLVTSPWRVHAKLAVLILLSIQSCPGYHFHQGGTQCPVPSCIALALLHTSYCTVHQMPSLMGGIAQWRCLIGGIAQWRW